MTTPARYRLPPPGTLATRDITAMGVPLDLVRSWVRRGRLHRCGGSPHYPWYRADDVAPLVADWQARRESPRPQQPETTMIIIAPAAPDLSHDIARALAAPPSYRAPDSLPAEETHAAIARALASPHTYRTPLPAQHAPELAESPPSQDQQPSSDQDSQTLGVLWKCWQRGDSTRAAAAAAGVSQSTASRQYRLFKYGAMAAQQQPR